MLGHGFVLGVFVGSFVCSFCSNFVRGWRRAARRIKASRIAGTRRDGGFPVLRAYIDTKALGTRTPETVTLADSNFFSVLGPLSEASLDPTLVARVNSYSERGASMPVTGTPGVSGAPLERAV